MANDRLTDILAFRDGAPTDRDVRRMVAYNGEALRELIDARMLALALALPRDLDPSVAWPLPPVSDLFDYLTSPLSEKDHAQRERALRGNPRAFVALLGIRKILEETPGEVPPIALPPASPRHDLGELIYRRIGAEILLGHAAGTTDIQRRASPMFRLRAPLLDADLDGDAFQDIGSRLERSFGRGNELDAFLARTEELIREVKSRAAKGRKAGFRRRDLSEELFEFARRLRDLGDEAAAAAKFSHPAGQVAEYISTYSDTLSSALSLKTSIILNVPELEYAIHLSAKAGPNPALEITCVSAGSPFPLSFDLTLVVPNKSFASSSIDAGKYGEIFLPSEPALVLIDGLSDTISFRIRSAEQ